MYINFLTIEQIEPELLYFILIIIGLIFGSFLCAITYRIPNNLSLYKESYCPKCSHTLKIKDLIPLLSWISSKGKCRYCYNKIHIRYPLIEIITSALIVITFAVLGINYLSIVLSFTTILLIAIVIIDLEHKIIPDSLQLILLFFGILYSYFFPRNYIDVAESFLVYGFFSIALRYIFLKCTNKDALGFGDIKFFFAVGIFLPISYMYIFLLFSGILGIIIALLWKKYKNEELFPFAPALCISLYICLMMIK